MSRDKAGAASGRTLRRLRIGAPGALGSCQELAALNDHIIGLITIVPRLHEPEP